MNNLEKIKEIILSSKRLVFFGGAGVSTASGIPDFRGNNGIYQKKFHDKFKPEEILSKSFFLNHPKQFREFILTNFIYEKAKPNFAHIALNDLEKKNILHGIITQNIDGLHQKAGNKKICELHGSIHRFYCTNCFRSYGLEDYKKTDQCVDCNGIIRPDIVLYEERLDEEIIQRAIQWINQADVLLVAGTSLTVFPASHLIDYYKGNKLILINYESTPKDFMADFIIHDSIETVFNDILKGVL